MPIPHARRMNLIALVLLVTALIAFVTFHFLPMYHLPMADNRHGWTVWIDMSYYARSMTASNSQLENILLSGLLAFAPLVSCAPFLVPVLRVSRLSWWLAVVTSGLTFTGSGGVLLLWMGRAGVMPGPAFVCLLASLSLNFLGLLFIRREQAPDLP